MPTDGIYYPTPADAAAARAARDEHRSQSRSNAPTPNPSAGASVPSGRVYELNGHDGSVVEKSRGASVQMGATDSSSILGTARTAHGSRVSLDKVDENSIVKFGGTEGRVRDAIAAGFLRRDETGRIVEVVAGGDGNDKPPQKTAADDADDKPTWGLPKEAEEPLIAAWKAAPDDVAGETLNHVLEVASKGGTIDLTEFASHMGMEKAEAHATLGKVQAAFQKQANSALGQAGILDAEAFYEWARKERSGDLRRAVSEQVRGNGTDVYQQLAASYIKSGHAQDDLSTFDDNSLHGPGVRVFKDASGRRLVEIHGDTMELRHALKHGLVARR